MVQRMLLVLLLALGICYGVRQVGMSTPRPTLGDDPDTLSAMVDLGMFCTTSYPEFCPF